MNKDYIIISKTSLKKLVFKLLVFAIVVIGIIWLCLTKPFLGFGYHDFGEQLFRLLLGIFLPIIIMTATDYLTIMLFNKKAITYIANFVEMLLICVKYCYSFLSHSDGELLGFTEPNVIIIMSIIFHLLFGILLYFIQVFILYKAVLKSTEKTK